MPPAARTRSAPLTPRTLTAASDTALLAARVRDLAPALDLSPLRPAITRLRAELSAGGLTVPHVWLSDHFFAKDRIPGFAIPFYLAHPRLVKLERRMMLDVEAGTPDWLLRVLRHEAGHALDTAYRLHARAGYRAMFGDYHADYPDIYRPNPASRGFVLHLDLWYAQSHPAEDFAETFAVWLNPRSDWRRAYAGWPALAKLLWVDRVMRSLDGVPAPVKGRSHHRPLRTIDTTLAEHYAEKRRPYQRAFPTLAGRDVRRLFKRGGRRPHAGPLLRRLRPRLRSVVNRWTGLPQLTIDRTLADLMDRADAQEWRLTRSPEQTERDLLSLLTAQVQIFLHDATHPITL